MTSHDNNWYEVMEPVPDKPGLYEFTFTSQFRWKIYFGASSQVITSGGHEWLANFTDVHSKELSLGWTASTPCFIIDDITGSGYWGPVPEVTESPVNAVIDSVTYEIVSSCVTETYNITVNAYFTGEPCSYKLTGTQFTRDIIRTSPVSPVIYTIKNLPAKEIPEEESVTFSLCSDGSGTAVLSTLTVTYSSPTLDCEVLHETIEACAGFPDIVLSFYRRRFVLVEYRRKHQVHCRLIRPVGYIFRRSLCYHTQRHRQPHGERGLRECSGRKQPARRIHQFL
jgi:hypothetical protein